MVPETSGLSIDQSSAVWLARLVVVGRMRGYVISRAHATASKATFHDQATRLILISSAPKYILLGNNGCFYPNLITHSDSSLSKRRLLTAMSGETVSTQVNLHSLDPWGLLHTYPRRAYQRTP
jgi:hypothetical protein